MIFLKVIAYTFVFRIFMEIFTYFLRRKSGKDMLKEKDRSFIAIFLAVFSSFAF